jgi:hypothetical protein
MQNSQVGKIRFDRAVAPSGRQWQLRVDALALRCGINRQNLQSFL